MAKNSFVAEVTFKNLRYFHTDNQKWPDTRHPKKHALKPYTVNNAGTNAAFCFSLTDCKESIHKEE